MAYPKCKKCGKEMFEAEDQEFMSTLDAVQRIYRCKCGEKCQAIYNFEEIEPSDIFYEDDL